MQRARQEINELQEELTVANEELRRQVESQDNQLETLKQKNATLSIEAKTYSEQVTFLTDKLQQTQEKYEDLEAHLGRVSHELETQKEISTEISAQRYGAQAENAAVSQRIVHLEAKLSNSKYELNALREKLKAEQSQRRSLENLVATLRQKAATNDSVISHLEEQRHVMAQEIQATHQRAATGSVSPAAMEVSELNHTPPTQLRDSIRSRAAEETSNHLDESRPRSSPSSRRDSDAPSSTPQSVGANSVASSSSILPLHALEMAQMKCQELEDRLLQQDETIKHLERSRSKFKRFAAKYERELEQRDRVIEELQTSNATFSSPDAQLVQARRSESEASSSSGRYSQSRRLGDSRSGARSTSDRQ